MKKTILIKYSDVRSEAKDIRKRINKLEKSIQNLSAGYPASEFYKKKSLLESHLRKLQKKEIELLEFMNQAEDYIESIEKSEIRTMFRLYYMDDLTWVQVAHRMNQMFPNRRISYTDDNCWRRNQRYFKEP